MKFRISYRAEYRYEAPVSLSPHVLRIFPRRDHQVRLLGADFDPPAGAHSSFRRDLFDNDICSMFFPELLMEMNIGMSCLLDSAERNPFDFLLESRALRIPIAYTPDERMVLDAFLSAPEDVSFLPAELLAREPRPTVEAILNWNRWIFENVRYERREEGAPWTAFETLRLGRASCRDFSALMLLVLRANGIASRLASGFLWEGDLDPGERHVAEGAMHAWVEAFLPGAGWIGIDPTNGVLCDQHAITTAVGLRAEDVAPVSGTYYSREQVGSTLKTFVKVEAVS